MTQQPLPGPAYPPPVEVRSGGTVRRVAGVMVAVLGGLEVLGAVVASVQAADGSRDSGWAVGLGFFWLLAAALGWATWRLLRPGRVIARITQGPDGTSYVPVPYVPHALRPQRPHPVRRKVAGVVFVLLGIVGVALSVHLTVLVATHRTDPSNGRGLGFAYWPTLWAFWLAWKRLRPREWATVVPRP